MCSHFQKKTLILAFLRLQLIQRKIKKNRKREEKIKEKVQETNQKEDLIYKAKAANQDR